MSSWTPDHPGVGAPPELTSAELAAITDPAALLERAWALEPALRLSERSDVLDQFGRLLESGSELPDVPGRAWRLELAAERAIDAAANVRLEQAIELADEVLREASPSDAVAIARATLARGRAIVWTGTEEATRQGDRVLVEAAERFAALGHREWQGFTVFWRGYAVCFESGDLPRAVELIGEALTILGDDSPRRSTVLNFYADALVELGDFAAAEAALAESDLVADRDEDLKSRAYTAWTRAHIAAARGDAFTTERLLREVERGGGDWFETHIGLAFLTDAVQVLDRLGLDVQAREFLAKARARVEDDESIRQAQAIVMARSGDPWQALEALQDLVRGDWLDKRWIWRHTLLSAWATFRAGRDGAAELAAHAFEQAVGCGGIRVALAGEPELSRALAPLAELAGSAAARELLLDGDTFVVRLLGAPSVVAADGTEVELPAGMPGELVRMLALHPHGLPVDVVLESFFPEAPLDAARQRLRQVLTRLRAAAGELVVRDGEHLHLAPAWVDTRRFLATADRVRSMRRPRSVQEAYAALALWRGPLLPTDLYASWAEEARRELEYRHLALLDLVAADAAARGSHQEALTALDAAMTADPYDSRRYAKVSEQLFALGRRGTAEYLARRAGVELGDERRLGEASGG
ncbi:MAG TPA: BTAD domain-containing putative transcriptional regulator [Solirubrobacteraceae bacterium]|nr:BTAD domain-containing putative transcriptional regulator [Solirubrobacteraceae bacterium]